MLNLANFKGPQDLHKNLAAGSWIILVARNSSEGGVNARNLTADEVVKAARGLQDKTGIDIVSNLPSKSVIVNGLARAKKVKSKDSAGKSFTNEFFQIVLPASNTIIFASTGSGRKQDSQFEQPFVQELLTLMKSRRPTLIFANRGDRIMRDMLVGAEILNVLRGIKGFIGNSVDGILLNDSMSQLFTLHKASGSETEAEGMPKKTRDSMKDKTDKKMKSGQLNFFVNIIPPAGTIKMTLRSETGSTGAKKLYLDDPAYFPEESNVSIGYPKKDDKKTKTNVELVQWALKKIGQPGVTKYEIGDYLANNGFSTPGMRHHHGPYATFEFREDPETKIVPVRSILYNLEFYKTGILQVRMGVAEVSDFEITDCFPASGKWADPNDFKRIEQYIESTGTGHFANASLVGVQVKTSDGLCRLGSRTNKDCRDDPEYALFKVTKNQSRKNFPLIPHSVLATSIVESLAEAAKTIWIPIESQANDVNPALQSEILKTQRNILRLERICEALMNQISEFDVQGNPLFDALTRQDLGHRRTQIINQEIEPEKMRVAGLELELLMEMEKLSSQIEAAPINLLTELIAGLKDPSDVTYNGLWKTCLSIESISKTSTMVKSHGQTALSWTGIFRISALSKTFEIPFSGSYVFGAITKVEGRVEKIIELMSQGVPLESIEIPRKQALRPALAKSLGYEGVRFILGSILDPRLLRIGMVIAREPSLSDEQIGVRLSEPELLISRVRSSIARNTTATMWAKSKTATTGRWFYLASLNNGLVLKSSFIAYGGRTDWVNVLSLMRKKTPSADYWKPVGREGAQLKACEHCGSFRRAISQLFEPVGLVCLDCHLDEAGLLWPSDPYDQWLDIATV